MKRHGYKRQIQWEVHGKKFKGRVTKANDKKALEINLVVEEIPEDDNKNQE